MSSKILIGRILHKAFGRNRSKGSVTTISHLPVLPVELWLVILEDVLDSFFSLDPAAEYIDNPAGLNDWFKVQGWEDNVFRQRRILRQVCHTWCNFVDLPEIKHRFSFARVRDIAQSDTRFSVTVAEILQARRIEGSIETLNDEDKNAVRVQLWKAVDEGGIFDAEIITNTGTRLTNLLLYRYNSALPRLKCLTINAYPFPDALFPRISERFPSIRFLSIKTLWKFDCPIRGFNFPSLSTLIIESQRFQGFSLDDHSLSSLSHLQIGIIVGDSDLQKLVAALPILGRQLRVLGVSLDRSRDLRIGINGTTYYPHAQFMSQFWDYVPILQSLRFPLPLILSHPPPRYHPIRYLINSDVRSAQYNQRTRGIGASSDNTDALIAFCLAAPRLAVVRESHDWALARHRARDGGFKYPELQEAYQDMYRVERRLQASNVKVRLEDVNGKTFGDS